MLSMKTSGCNCTMAGIEESASSDKHCIVVVLEENKIKEESARGEKGRISTTASVCPQPLLHMELWHLWHMRLNNVCGL